MNYGYIYGYENIFTILLAIVGFVVVIWAQTKVSSSYKKYKDIKNSKGLCGQEVARKILDSNNLSDIHIVEVKGNLTDHYDPSKRVIRLSHDIFHGETIAAISVAAHECGHAIQDKVGYTPMKIRSALVPVVNLVTYLGYIGMFISIFAGVTGYLMVSIIVLLATLLFQLVTLPVEFDASKRAEEQLKKLGISDDYEAESVKSMLSAAAMTYVASVISSLLSLLRIIIMFSNRRD